MKSPRRLPVFFALLILASMSCFAYPTIYGDTGLVMAPTADVTPFYSYQLAVNYAQVTQVGESSSILPIRLNYGLNPDVEIYAAFGLGDVKEGFQTYGAGTKIRVVNENRKKSIPLVAIGARMTRVNSGLNSTITNGYAVVSASLYEHVDTTNQNAAYSYANRVRLHAGAEFSHYSGDFTGNFLRPFAGLSYERSNGSSMVVDYMPKIRSGATTLRRSTLSAAVRYPFDDQLKLEFGTTRPYGITDSSLYAGFLYYFGGQEHYNASDVPQGDIPETSTPIYY